MTENSIRNTAQIHLQRYYQWLNYPFLDHKSKQELALMEHDEDNIKDHFGQELEFGTGGMRGIMGVGTNRFNRYIVRRATQGLAYYLMEFHSRSGFQVVIAYDPRANSHVFAIEAALVLAANNIRVLLFDSVRPVPLLSYGVRYTNSSGGIIITASHNPPEYNGYKVYGEDGGQCVPSATEKIVQYINQIDIFNHVFTVSKEYAQENNLLAYIGEEVDNAYLSQVKSLSSYHYPRGKNGSKARNKDGSKDLTVVYSPLHGSGYPFVPKLLNDLGYQGIYLVEEQIAQDPNFPTVEIPNPEDQASFSLALKVAKNKGAHLVIATDPDCDRLGCGIKTAGDDYLLLNGNQIGALLLNYRLERLFQRGELPPNGIMIKTIVTGNLGKKIAAYYGVHTEETLTGFKYIGEKIKEYEEQGTWNFIFGYEESYGYLAGTFVRDKDGIITSSLLVEMTSYYQDQGKTLEEKLEELYHRFGYHLEEVVSFKLEHLELVKHIFTRLKNQPPRSIGGLTTEEMRDYQEGRIYSFSTGKTRDTNLPRTPALYFLLEGESWCCLRPSGTEPKLKIYYSAVGNSFNETQNKLQFLKENMEEILKQEISAL